MTVTCRYIDIDRYLAVTFAVELTSCTTHTKCCDLALLVPQVGQFHLILTRLRLSVADPGPSSVVSRRICQNIDFQLCENQRFLYRGKISTKMGYQDQLFTLS